MGVVELLDILVCPVPECRGPLTAQSGADGEPRALACERCGRVYRVEEGWPVLIPEEADRPPRTDG